jgi:arginine decarboxylase
LFTYGVLNLEQRAKAEDLFRAIATKIVGLAKGNPELDDIKYALEQELSDSYFCNFSVFQSLPDSWALDQLFPIMPIHRLNERPDRRAVLVDITCDSDGNITNFIDTETGGEQKYLEVHSLEHGQPYYLAAFLTGAYQEILGDLHNLFGDTDAVHVSLTENGGYQIDHVVEGDDIKEVLQYVEYSRADLLERVRKATESSILKGTISRSEARLLLEHYERGLSSYTYLTEETAMPFQPHQAKKEFSNGTANGTDHTVHQS